MSTLYNYKTGEVISESTPGELAAAQENKMNKPIPETVVEAVARAICVACKENPDYQGDARGNEFRWQDYNDVALAAISALESAKRGLRYAGYECHCGTCTCNPNMTPAVRFDLSPAQKEGVIREHLIRLGWTPPDERGANNQHQQNTNL